MNIRLTAVFLLALAAAACRQEPVDPELTAPKASLTGEIVLPADSPKRQFIKVLTVAPTSTAVMEPVAGMIAYDDTRTARITSPLAGRVVSALPALGAAVKVGTPLVELDSPELGQAKEDYQNALADAELADKAFRRANELFEGAVLPRKELEKAQDDVQRARNEVQRTRLRLRNLGAPETGVDDRFALRSPVTGEITERHINPGMEVRPDLPDPLFIVSDLNHLWVLMDVYEKDLGHIHVGMKVMVTVPAYPNETFPATVTYIDKVVDNDTRTVKVRCAIDNPGEKLLPAMYATVELLAEQAQQAIVLPLSAIFTQGEGDAVFVVTGDGRYQQKAVTVGTRFKDRAIVAQGINSGDTVVVDGALLLRAEQAQATQAGAAP